MNLENAKEGQNQKYYYALSSPDFFYGKTQSHNVAVPAFMQRRRSIQGHY